MESAQPDAIVVTRGTCYVLVAFDVGLSGDLAACERGIAGQRRALREHGRAVAYFEYRPAPLWLAVDGPPVTVGTWTSGPQVSVTVYDFGAVWDATIQRTLQTIEGIYTKRSDEAAARRMEPLEWIIVWLIAISIVLPFL